jgi:NADH:ubiquinone oxidoreductase subunit 6 (subunit J)
MKHVFYVIYVLFYTGAVFVTGLFVGQLLERSWEARRNSSQKISGAERENVALGTVVGQRENPATGKRS